MKTRAFARERSHESVRTPFCEWIAPCEMYFVVADLQEWGRLWDGGKVGETGMRLLRVVGVGARVTLQHGSVRRTSFNFLKKYIYACGGAEPSF